MMDKKEAQVEEIAQIILGTIRQSHYDTARALYAADYRKLPERPKVLSVAEMQTIAANIDDQGNHRYSHTEMRALLKAQLEADIRHYEGEQ